jgi:hypothetical protein
VRATIGTGPVGTGVFVREQRPVPDGSMLADAWLCVAFLPVVPLCRWRIERVTQPTTDSSIEIVVRERLRIPFAAVTKEVGRAASGALLTVATMVFGVATIGVPWASQPLRSFGGGLVRFLARHQEVLTVLGRKVQSMIPGLIDAAVGAAGMAIETTVFLAGAAIPIVVLMRLDLSTPRVSLGSVFRSGDGVAD